MRMRKWLRSWVVQVGVAGAAVAVVLTAPFASPNPASAKVVIAGASSLSDRVTVNFAEKPPKPDKRDFFDKPDKPDKLAKASSVHILAFNDLHGNLQAGGNNIYGEFAGGAAYLAKMLKERQAMYGDAQATVFAGDNIGASPLENGLFFEEPITIATNMMHVDAASVGNHEFDKGAAELLRIQNGGCRPVEGCTAAPYALPQGGKTRIYPGANFPYLSANVKVTATGKTLFPAWKKVLVRGDAGYVDIGFIGEVLESTPTIVTPTGVAGLTFEDEADAANDVLNDKNADEVDAWVLVIHEGGAQTSAALNGCAGNLAGSPILDIASRLDPRIKIIVSAHTHNEYRCTITAGGVTRLITSAASFGRILTDITLDFDAKNNLLAASATNTIVKNALNPRLSSSTVRQPDTSKEDPQVQAVVNQYVTASAPLANQVIGRAQGDLNRTDTNGRGETTLGDVIADAQLVATQPPPLGGAQLAFMNPGGVRADLPAALISGGEQPGQVTYGEAFTIQPFGNSLVTKTMTGDMIRRLLQQQFSVGGVPCNGGTVSGSTPPRVLQISSTFKYESAPNAATCEGKVGQMWVNGVLVQPTDSFRVTMNNFLATGGDGFTVFNEGTNSLGGAQDIDALVAYFQAAGATGIAVPPLNRIVAKP
jgi:5'-nucleotidase